MFERLIQPQIDLLFKDLNFFKHSFENIKENELSFNEIKKDSSTLKIIIESFKKDLKVKQIEIKEVFHTKQQSYFINVEFKRSVKIGYTLKNVEINYNDIDKKYVIAAIYYYYDLNEATLCLLHVKEEKEIENYRIYIMNNNLFICYITKNKNNYTFKVETEIKDLDKYTRSEDLLNVLTFLNNILGLRIYTPEEVEIFLLKYDENMNYVVKNAYFSGKLHQISI